MDVSWTEIVSLANIQYVLFWNSKDEIGTMVFIALSWVGKPLTSNLATIFERKTPILFEGVCRLSKHCVWKFQTITQV